MKKLLLFVFVILPLLLVLAIAAIVLTGLDDRPIVATGAQPNAASLARGKALVESFRASLLRPEELTTLSASEVDVNRMLALAGRGIKHASFDATIRPTGMTLASSVRLPRNPLGEYFNAWIGFVPSTSGLKIDNAEIGNLEIPGWVILAAMRVGLDNLLGAGRGDEALESIRELSFRENQVTVTYRPTPELIAELRSTAQEAYRQVVADIDPELVRVYYGQLVGIGRRLTGPNQVSFTEFLGPLLATAKQRSASGDAANENAAAIVAMAIYFGDDRFEKIVGPVKTGDLAGAPPSSSHVRLRGRHDLVQHFTISAALTVTAGLGVADVIGELKEIGDTGAGGSGFSFTDIAADRAGARFGETATSDRGAPWVQNLLAGQPVENMFFPPVTGLPEFMPSAEFVRRYGEIGSPEYENVIGEIDRRVSGLAVFGS